MGEDTKNKDSTLIWWNKKDFKWVRQESSHRRLKRAQLIRMAVIDWLRENAQTKEPK